MRHKLLIFKDEALLRQALTHRSYINESLEDAQDNERLEFLGDAILTFLSGEYLYRRYPEMGEDEMTRRRSALVDESQLAKFAIEVGLDFRMRLGRGAIQEGGYQNANLLSSTFEAVVGAYYLDSRRSVEAVRPIVEALFDSVPQDVTVARSHVDSKNQLQELVQGTFGAPPPLYKTEKIGGSDHAPEFVSRVFMSDPHTGELSQIGEGRGRSKKEAEKQAAEDALIRLKQRLKENL
jgi:ribonuclease III